MSEPLSIHLIFQIASLCLKLENTDCKRGVSDSFRTSYMQRLPSYSPTASMLACSLLKARADTPCFVLITLSGYSGFLSDQKRMRPSDLSSLKLSLPYPTAMRSLLIGLYATDVTVRPLLRGQVKLHKNSIRAWVISELRAAFIAVFSVSSADVPRYIRCFSWYTFWLTILSTTFKLQLRFSISFTSVFGPPTLSTVVVCCCSPSFLPSSCLVFCASITFTIFLTFSSNTCLKAPFVPSSSSPLSSLS
mmetsp:Transcript_4872/g.10299  ORF Transcript_4872/g.10299 Transcript_4872/m.10299 type:complete len:248 (+) Transcript_4872:979-1722(+)